MATPPGAGEGASMPLKDHLRELRARVVKAALAVTVGVIIAFVLRDKVIAVLENQVCDNASISGVGKPSAQCPNGVLTLSGPTAGITLAFKVAFFGGLILAAPVWLYQAWAFVAPGLYRNEKRYGYGFTAAAVPMFTLGCAMCYAFFPKIMGAMIGSGFTPRGVAVQLPLDTFLVFYLRMATVFGISFVLPLFLVVGNLLGILTGAKLLAHWRVVVLAVFVFSAIAVPTGDPIGMCVLAVPLCSLYFAAAAFAKANDSRRARRRAAEPNAALSPDEASDLDLRPSEIQAPSPLIRR
jgi:sec-independent protein translocase protein TatC